MNFPTLINGKKLDNYTDWIAGSFLITLMSLPGGSVPAGKTSDGLPVGIQIVGPRFEEPLILSVMKIVQQTHPDRLAASRLSGGDARGKGGERGRRTPEQPAEHIGIALEAVARIGAKHFCQCLALIVVHAGAAGALSQLSMVSASARTVLFSAWPNVSAISIWLSGGVPTSS